LGTFWDENGKIIKELNGRIEVFIDEEKGE